MRKFDISQFDSIKKKRGMEAMSGAHVLPNMQPLSSKVSIGTIYVKPSEQQFHVANPLDYALQRNPLAMSLGCKEVTDLVVPERGLYSTQNNIHTNQRPHFGNQRGDPRGIAYQPIHPVNNPLLQKTNNFYSYLPNPLGA